MKLTELIDNAGRPVAYYPRLRAVAGSTNATLLLCQLIYWCGKQKDGEGWIYKRAKLARDEPEGDEDPNNQSIAQETGLSYKELLAARRLLRARGLIRERRDYMRHRFCFQVDFEALQRAWQQSAGDSVPNEHQVGAQRSPGRFPSGTLLNGTDIDYTETTTQRATASLESTIEAQVSQATDEHLPTTPLQAMHHAAIRLFQEVCRRIPGARDYQLVIETMRHFQRQKGEQTIEYLKPFWLAWSSRRRRFDGKPYDPGALTWLTEWAVNGSIPPEYGGSDGRQPTRQQTGKTLTEEDIAAAGRINRRRRQADLRKV